MTFFYRTQAIHSGNIVHIFNFWTMNPFFCSNPPAKGTQESTGEKNYCLSLVGHKQSFCPAISTSKLFQLAGHMYTILLTSHTIYTVIVIYNYSALWPDVVDSLRPRLYLSCFGHIFSSVSRQVDQTSGKIPVISMLVLMMLYLLCLGDQMV